jgi:D-psicose/D-tagatose/L-ribulose 3-epimerase
VNFGVNTFNFVSPFDTATHLPLLDRVQAMGFDLIEIAFEDPATIDSGALAGRAAGLGLGVLACGVFGSGRNLVSADAAERRAAADYIRGLIDAAARFAPTLPGIPPVVGGPMYGAVGKTPAAGRDARQRERDLAAAELRPLAAYAGDRGVRLALELLNRFETDLLNVVEQGLNMLDAIGSPHVGLHLDTFHMHLEERDSAAAIRQAGARLFHFHACENDRGVPGRGQVAWPAVAGSLRDVQYDGAVVIESFTPEVTSIARAVCIWRDIAPSQDAIAGEGLAFLRGLVSYLGDRHGRELSNRNDN